MPALIMAFRGPPVEVPLKKTSQLIDCIGLAFFLADGRTSRD